MGVYCIIELNATNCQQLLIQAKITSINLLLLDKIHNRNREKEQKIRMKIRQYLPIIIILLLFGVLVSANNYLVKKQPVEPDLDPKSPELYQSQAADRGNSLKNVVRFDLEVELNNDDEIEMSYWTDNHGNNRATVRRENERRDDDEARQEVEILISSLPPLDQTEPLTLVQAVLDQLRVHQKDIEDFELEYKLNDGSYHKIEMEIDDKDDDPNDDD